MKAVRTTYQERVVKRQEDNSDSRAGETEFIYKSMGNLKHIIIDKECPRFGKQQKILIPYFLKSLGSLFILLYM